MTFAVGSAGNGATCGKAKNFRGWNQGRRLAALACALLVLGMTPPAAQAAGDPLAGIAVVPHVKRTDYRRPAFGVGWPGDGHGCDVRDDILTRDLTALTFKRTSRCGQAVASGMLNDPYTGEVISFVRGEGTSAAVQIDHVVPLAYAWDMGAWAWTPAQRAQFYADPNELLAVSGKANDEKGDLPPGLWMPPNQSFDCAYTARFVGVLRTYNLPVDDVTAGVVRQENCP